uniref:Uncharacterized protein n=1 Tax=Dunaliella tertiolecta TaxID=3047 RepID=A0A7S3VQX7_DUNTE
MPSFRACTLFDGCPLPARSPSASLQNLTSQHHETTQEQLKFKCTGHLVHVWQSTFFCQIGCKTAWATPPHATSSASLKILGHKIIFGMLRAESGHAHEWISSLEVQLATLMGSSCGDGHLPFANIHVKSGFSLIFADL